MIFDLSTLTPKEIVMLRELAARWKCAHDAREFETADAHRQELIEWGAWPPEDGWHPVFESSTHRFARFTKRLAWPFAEPEPRETSREEHIARQYAHFPPKVKW